MPYVEWWCYSQVGDDDEEWDVQPPSMAICVDCCRELKRALMADLVRVVAFDDFRRASPVSEVRQ
jgi:hypothetical protein